MLAEHVLARCSCGRSSGARRSSGTARPARSGAGSRRSGSGRAAGSGAARARRSPGRPGAGASPLRLPRPSAQRPGEQCVAASRRSRAMKNPSVRSRSGRVCRKRGSRPSGELGVGGAEVVGPDRGVVAEQRREPLLVLAHGDRAGRVDERAPGAEGAGRSARGWPPVSEPGARSARATCATVRRAWRRARRDRSRADPRGSDRSRRRGRRLQRPLRPPACRRRPAARRARAVGGPGRGRASTATISPWFRIRAAIAVALMPGAAQRSRTRSPGFGSSTSTTACEPRACATSAPSWSRSRATAPSRPRTTNPSGDASGGGASACSTSSPAARSSRQDRARVGPDRVHSQRRLRGLVHRGHDRPRLGGTKLLPPHPREPLGV